MDINGYYLVKTLDCLSNAKRPLSIGELYEYLFDNANQSNDYESVHSALRKLEEFRLLKRKGNPKDPISVSTKYMLMKSGMELHANPWKVSVKSVHYWKQKDAFNRRIKKYLIIGIPLIAFLLYKLRRKS
jgi:hypothetical protein